MNTDGLKKQFTKSLAINTGSNGFFYLIQIGIQFLTFAILIRILGLEPYGVLMLAGALIGQFSFLDGGLSIGLQKHIPEFRVSQTSEKIGRAVSSTVVFYFGLGIVVALILLTLAVTGSMRFFGVQDMASANQVITAAAVISIFQWPMMTFENVGKGFNLFHPLNIIQVFEVTIQSALTIIAAILGIAVVWIFILRFLPYVGGTYFRYRLIKKHYPNPLFILDREAYHVFRSMINYSGWVFLIQLSGVLINRFDRVIVCGMLNVSHLPIYEGIMRAYKGVIQLCSILKSAVLPIASEVHSIQDQTLFHDMCFKGTRALNAILASFTITTIIFAKPILHIIGGSILVDYAWTLQLGLFLTLPVMCRMFLNTALIGAGHIISLQGRWSVLTSFVYVMICITGMNLLGLKGAILAHSITHLLMMPLWLIIIFNHVSFKQASFWKAVVLGQWPSWVVLLFSLPIIGLISSQKNTIVILSLFFVFLSISLVFSLYGSLEKKHRSELFVKIKRTALNY